MGAATLSNTSLASLLNGLLAWWGCHEASGNSRLDATGNGNTLAETNGAVANAQGLIGQAASFTKTNYLKQATKVVASGPYTLACWVNPTDLNSYILMGQAQAGTTGNFTQMTSTAVAVRTAAAPNLLTVQTPLVVGVWSHVAAAFDGASVYLYVNGVLIGVNAVTATYGSTTFALGALSSAGSSIFNGLLQLAGVWGRALGGNEVYALYNNGLGIDYPFQGGG